jgi:quercetin dioxygenase-like cupin family protein
MKVVHFEEIPLQEVTMEGAQGCKMRHLIGEPDGAPNFTMRQFEVAPGGHTPHHQHHYEHEVFVLSGRGIVIQNGREFPIGPGSVVFVPGGVPHQFRNTGPEPLRFLCLIPNAMRGGAVSCVVACGCD